ncbi:MAG: hypothetical protein KIT70_08620 [Anaerolineales bacterium]|nr:MAG: hypothetical protein KIT70_08620 [Anaerolineales bacterium]
MLEDRPIFHSVYHRGMEQHSRWKPSSPRQLDLMLKTSALFSRSIIIPDSDLNNHSLLAQLTQATKTSCFGEALEIGFLRRAARLADDDDKKPVLTQQELYEQFSKNSPKLAALVPSSHPRALDRLLASSEKRIAPPTWKVADAASLFADRMLFEFKRARLSRAARKLASLISEYISKEREDIKSLRGGKIAELFLPERESNIDQRKIWLLLQKAYNGNLVGSFKGDLIMVESPTGEIDMIPGGPVPDADEEIFTKEYYLNAKLGAFEDFYTVGIGQVAPFKAESPNFLLKLDRLLELSLQEIEELRESADPQAYFDTRFRALGNGKEYHKHRELLHEERLGYWARLEKAGLTLWKRAQDRQLKYYRDAYITRRVSEDDVDLEREKRGFLANFVMEITQAGILSLGVDWFSLTRRSDEIEQAKKRKGNLYRRYSKDSKFLFPNDVLKRPDFRVIQKLVSRD